MLKSGAMIASTSNIGGGAADQSTMAETEERIGNQSPTTKPVK